MTHLSLHLEFLKEHNVTTILTVSDKIKPPFPDEFKYELIEIRDGWLLRLDL